MLHLSRRGTVGVAVFFVLMMAARPADNTNYAVIATLPGVISDLKANRAGEVFASDISGRRILRIPSNGKVEVFAGSGETGDSDGPALQARFAGPGRLAFDPEGNLWVRDGAFAIRKITEKGVVSTPITNVFSAFNLSPDEASCPGLAIGPDGRIAVGYNQRTFRNENLLVVERLPDGRVRTRVDASGTGAVTHSIIDVGYTKDGDLVWATSTSPHPFGASVEFGLLRGEQIHSQVPPFEFNEIHWGRFSIERGVNESIFFGAYVGGFRLGFGSLNTACYWVHPTECRPGAAFQVLSIPNPAGSEQTNRMTLFSSPSRCVTNGISRYPEASPFRLIAVGFGDSVYAMRNDQLIQVRPPTCRISVICPPDQIRSALGDSIVVDYPDPVATSNCGPITNIVCHPLNHSKFPLGETMVTCTAFDSRGNSNSSTFKVTVLLKPDWEIICPPQPISLVGSPALLPDPSGIIGVVTNRPITGGLTFQWTGSQGVMTNGTPLAVGRHLATNRISDAKGNQVECVLNFAVTLAPPPGLVLWLPFDHIYASFIAENLAAPHRGFYSSPGHRPSEPEAQTSFRVEFGSSVYVPPYPAIDFARRSFTVAGWVRPDGGGSNYEFTFAASDGVFSVAMVGSTTPANPESLVLRHRLAGMDVPLPEGLQLRTVPVDRQWHFLVVTFRQDSEGVAITEYLDGAAYPGERSRFKIPAGWNPPGPQPTYTGGKIGTPSDGSIDELMFFNRVLTPMEIGDLHRTGRGGVSRSHTGIPTIRYTAAPDRRIVVTWDENAELEGSERPQGPYVPIRGAKPPLIIAPDGQMKFWRMNGPAKR